MADLEVVMGTTAMAPADVAGLVVEAIAAQRFWVVTHDATVPRVQARNDELSSAIGLDRPKVPATDES
jgi:hypothetical protein